MTAPQTAPAIQNTLASACEKALTYHVQGHLDLAGQVYRAILEIEPQHATANYALGMLLLQSGPPDLAITPLQTAIGTDPRNLEYWCGYIEALIKLGRTAMAAQIVKVAQSYGLDRGSVAAIAARLGKDGLELAKAKKAPVAGAASQKRVKGLAPSKQRIQQVTHLLERGHLNEALFLARLLTDEFPKHGFGWKVFAALQASKEQHNPSRQTMDALRTAAELLPADAEAAFNYCYGLSKTDQSQLMRERLEALIAVHPRHAMATGMLGAELCKEGSQPELAGDLMRRALKLDPNIPSVHSALLFLMQELPDPDPAALLEAHRAFDAVHCARFVRQWPRHANVRDPERRLKIGLVSGDFHDHSVAYFTEPVLAGFAARSDFELHVYYNNTITDSMKTHLQALVPHWNDVFPLDDAALAARIEQDQIDILIDLSGHTAFNRLLMFARKPAPLQATWLGYPGTTGLQAMDYLLGDPYFLPPGRFDAQLSEKVVYLPSVDPYRPPSITPDINTLPALTNGYLTFASLNRTSKITPQAIAVWAQLLRALPTSRLLVGHLTEDHLPPRLARAFAAEGINEERILCHRKQRLDHYLYLHHQIDICLDTFPYNGGTTVNTANWMGVPTLTLAGCTPAGHQAASSLLKLGLQRFVAPDVAAFVAEGIYWSTHLEELDALRTGMRARVLATPGRQTPVIVEGLAQAFRTMWRKWCAGEPVQSFSVADTR